MKILLAKPRGFCAGVDRAIDTVKLALEVYGQPIYVKHAIVHNDYIVNDLEKQGVVFIESVSEIPQGAHAIFSAHGSPPDDYQEAKAREIKLIDATCPLVTKVHLEARRFAREGYTIILVGHKGHIELAGTSGEAPNSTVIVETYDDIKRLDLASDTKIAVLTQTTLSVDDTKSILEAIKKKFSSAVLPLSSDICYATTNRQRAVKALAKKSDIILVVGSAASSNTNRLVEVTSSLGKSAYRIDGPADIRPAWLQGAEKIGVTSGASAPEKLVMEVVKHLKNKYAAVIKELKTVQEHVWFDLPAEIKQAARDSKISSDLLEKHVITANSKMSV